MEELEGSLQSAALAILKRLEEDSKIVDTQELQNLSIAASNLIYALERLVVVK